MRKGASDSVIVNNFFTLASIILIVIVIVIYSKYIVDDGFDEITKTQVVPLECEKEVFTVSKVYNQELLNESMKALNKGYYRFQGDYKKSLKMESIIESFISINEMNSYYIDTIGKTPKKDINKYLTIKYEIIENDRKDNSKKLTECKFCSGAILTTFMAEDKEIFKFYMDFRLFDKKEIASAIDCTIKVYENHVKKL